MLLVEGNHEEKTNIPLITLANKFGSLIGILLNNELCERRWMPSSDLENSEVKVCKTVLGTAETQ